MLGDAVISLLKVCESDKMAPASRVQMPVAGIFHLGLDKPDSLQEMNRL